MSLTLQPDRASHPAKPEEPTVSATITDEQFAARDLVRSWAAGTGAADTVRDIEDGQADAWRSVYDGVAELGLFGVAVAEEAGGAGGSVIDLCAMVEEAARALIPGPVATTALASLVVSDPVLLQALSAGQMTAGAALSADLLLVPHHGSKTSSIPAFVRAVAAMVKPASVSPRTPVAVPVAVCLTPS